MFQFSAPKLDPAEEKRRMIEEAAVSRAIVQINIFSFVACIGLICAGIYH